MAAFYALLVDNYNIKTDERETKTITVQHLPQHWVKYVMPMGH